MIKRYLLKLAYIINKHYKTIELHQEDQIKFKNSYFCIVQTCFNQELGCVDTLNIKAQGIDYLLQFRINN